MTYISICFEVEMETDMENTTEIKIGEATYMVSRTFAQDKNLKDLLTEHLVEKRRQEKTFDEKSKGEIA